MHLAVYVERLVVVVQEVQFVIMITIYQILKCQVGYAWT